MLAIRETHFRQAMIMASAAALATDEKKLRHVAFDLVEGSDTLRVVATTRHWLVVADLSLFEPSPKTATYYLTAENVRKVSSSAGLTAPGNLRVWIDTADSGFGINRNHYSFVEGVGFPVESVKKLADAPRGSYHDWSRDNPSQNFGPVFKDIMDALVKCNFTSYWFEYPKAALTRSVLRVTNHPWLMVQLMPVSFG